MIKTKIFSGPTEIISSGSVISYSGHPIDMTLDFNDWELKIIYKFEDGESQKFNVKAIDNNTIEVTFINFNNSLGIGNVQPVKLAMHKGKLIFLSFRIYSLSDSDDRMMHYTLYKNLKEETNLDD